NFRTTGLGCLAGGAGEGMGPTCLTVSAVVGGEAAAACASAARMDVSDARRSQAETSGSAATAAKAPAINAENRVKRRCMKPPREQAPQEQPSAPTISTGRS